MQSNGQKTKTEREPGRQRDISAISYRRCSARLTVMFSSETMDRRKQWGDNLTRKKLSTGKTVP
jgi:hypothetical protein